MSCELFELSIENRNVEVNCKKFVETEILSIYDKDGYEIAKTVLHREGEAIVAIVDNKITGANMAIKCKREPRIIIDQTIHIECDDSVAVWI